MAEGLDDGGEEEEEDAPCEADPQGEENDDGLSEEHFCGPHEGDFEHFGDGGLFEFGGGVDGAVQGFAEAFGARGENYVAAGFAEDDVEEGDEGGVVDYLDVEDPAGGCQLDFSQVEHLRTIARVTEVLCAASGSARWR